MAPSSSSRRRSTEGTAPGTSRRRFRGCPMCPRPLAAAWLGRLGSARGRPARLGSARPGPASARPRGRPLGAPRPAPAPAPLSAAPPRAARSQGGGAGDGVGEAGDGQRARPISAALRRLTGPAAGRERPMRGEGRGEGRERGGGEALIGCGALRGAAPGAASGAAAVRSGRQGDRRHGHALSRQATPHARAARVLPSAPKSPKPTPLWVLGSAPCLRRICSPAAGAPPPAERCSPRSDPAAPKFRSPPSRAMGWGSGTRPAPGCRHPPPKQHRGGVPRGLRPWGLRLASCCKTTKNGRFEGISGPSPQHEISPRPGAPPIPVGSSLAPAAWPRHPQPGLPPGAFTQEC